MKFEKLQEEIEDILYSVQNKAGNSHLFNTDLCTDVAEEIVGSLKRHLTPAAPDSEGRAVLEGDVYNIEYVEGDKITLTRCQ